MIPSVVCAAYKGGYRIEIVFEDGKKGIVDFSKYLKRGGVFDRFKDLDFFRTFKINPELGVLTWRDEIDVSPETLYAQATGSNLPDWVEKKRSVRASKTNQRTASNRR